MKKIINKVLISIGGLALASIPMITSAAFIKNSDQIEETSFEQESIKDFWYYTKNKNELDELIKPNFASLAIQGQNDGEVMNFIASMDGADLLEKDSILWNIYKIKTSEEMKLFILQNFLDKYNKVFADKTEALKENEEKYLSTVTSEIYNEKEDVSEEEWNGESETPVTDLSEGEEQHLLSLRSTYNQSELRNINGSRYELSAINVYEAQAWDMGESKGEVDRITGKYFSQLLNDIHRQKGAGWYDYDADTAFWSRRVRFTFRDKNTGTTDSINLVYNTAQDTTGTNEDYSFVAIQGTTSTKWTYDQLGRKAPTIFGKPMSFDLMSLYNIGAKIDNNYMISAHQVDAGSDNDTGDVLAGVPLAPVLNAREGTRSLKLIAKSFYEYIYLQLNQPYIQTYMDSLNHLHFKLGDEILLYRNQNSTLETIYGEDKQINNWNVFADDVTEIYWSTNTILNFSSNASNSIGKDIYNILNDVKDKTIEAAKIATFNIKTASLISKLQDMRFYLNWGEFPDAAIKDGSFVLNLLTLTFDLGSMMQKTNWEDSSSVTEFVTKAYARTAVAATIIGVQLIPVVGQLVSALLSTLWTVANTFKFGNGYTLWENFDDHGLNDWNFQLKENTYHMAKIAQKLSNNKRAGVVWKVTDGWWTLPNLYVKSQVSSSWTELSNYGGFNFGNKINYPYI